MRVTRERAYWPHLVRKLLDNGWSTEDLAKALEGQPDDIRRYVGGAVPHHRAQRRLLRLIADYRDKRARAGNPIPEQELLPEYWHPEPVRPQRGVYREEIAPLDETWYKIVLSSGKVGTVRLPNELVDAQFAENLWRRLDARDPINLRAVK